MRATVCATSSIARWMISSCLRARSLKPVSCVEHRVDIQRDGRDRVVDVVRDAARHLAERAQALLLQDGVLSELQIFVGLLQRSVQLRLVRRQRHVIAELAQEFALAAAECAVRAPRHHQHAEHAAALFDHERHDDHRLESAARQALRKRELDGGDVGFVDQLARHAAAQTVFIDLDARLLRHRELDRQQVAACADAAHREKSRAVFVIAQHGEIHGQVLFDAAHHHLEDAFEVLALGDGARDSLQQVEPFELQEGTPLGALAGLCLEPQVGVGRLELGGALGYARFEHFVAGLQLAFGEHALRRVGGAHLRETEQQIELAHDAHEMRENRHLVTRPYRIEHHQRHAERDRREYGEHAPETVRIAYSPIPDDHGDPQQRRQDQRGPRDTQKNRRAVSRQREQRHQARGHDQQPDGEQRYAAVTAAERQRQQQAHGK